MANLNNEKVEGGGGEEGQEQKNLTSSLCDQLYAKSGRTD